MEVTNKRLATIFDNLKNSDIVLSRNVNDTTIAQFTKLLNKATPVTESDNAIGDCVRFLYKQNRASFFKYITINNLIHLILLTDGTSIASMLGLKALITIQWDRQQREFVVTRGSANDIFNIVNDDTPVTPLTPSTPSTPSSPKPRHRGKRGGRAERERREARESMSPGKHNAAKLSRLVVPSIVTSIAPLSNEQCVNILNSARKVDNVPKKSFLEVATAVSAVSPDDDARAYTPIEGRSWADVTDDEDDIFNE